MVSFIHPFHIAARALPLLLAIGVTAGTPAHANQGLGGDGRDGQGDAPQLRYISTYELSRMSNSALFDLTYGLSVNRISGQMARYNLGKISRAMRGLRGPTTRLMQRIEDAGTLEDRKEIVDGLLVVFTARLKASDTKLNEVGGRLSARETSGKTLDAGQDDSISGDELSVDSYTTAYLDYAGLRAFVELLKHMKQINDGVRQ